MVKDVEPGGGGIGVGKGGRGAGFSIFRWI